MKNKVTISDKSVDASLTNANYKEAISEFIWNGFDARASNIELNYTPNNLGGLESLKIKDNGDGINFHSLNQTFGSFLDSPKKHSIRSSYTRGKKGKGRFYFTIFASKATWQTTFEEKGKFYTYEITINKNDKAHYDNSDELKEVNVKAKGTEVSFENFSISEYTFDFGELKHFLAEEFGWFLFLNKENNFSIKINGTEVEYDYLIEDNEEAELNIDDYKFKINYIRWSNKIGDKYYYYFLNSNKKESCKILTSFNNKKIDFHHSLYIQSEFFDNFKLEHKFNQESFLYRNANDPIFRELKSHIKYYLTDKNKKFIKHLRADKLITDYERRGLLPKFKNNEYSQKRKEDLIEVVKEIYSVQPKIFEGLKDEQVKTSLGFLNILLDTDERESILDIVGEVVKLNDEEREEFAKILKKTNLSRIIETLKLIKKRKSVIIILKALIYDLERFTNERNHIQKAIENNYWLFGEQFHLASADENFETLLSEYLYILDGKKEKEKLESKNKDNRPDIFMCSKHDIPDSKSNEYISEENILVELKRPSIKIGKKQFDQVEGYLRFIIDEPKFNSQLRRWKFFIVGKEIDSYLKDKYESQKHKGKLFLVEQIRNYEIYAMSWDDIFHLFEIRHKYLYDKLNIDKTSLEEELGVNNLTLNRESSNELSKKVINIKEHNINKKTKKKKAKPKNSKHNSTI